MMNVDNDPSKLFPNHCLPANNAEKAMTIYYCSLPFKNVINPLKNSKFPGNQVINLKKKHIKTFFSGYIPKHVLYSDLEISIWTQASTINKQQDPKKIIESFLSKNTETQRSEYVTLSTGYDLEDLHIEYSTTMVKDILQVPLETLEVVYQ